MAGEADSLQADVLVAGGGTAGSAAAVAAARAGCKVLLVEEANCLGGTSTTGGVSEWFASLDGCGEIFDEIHDEMSRFGAAWKQRFNVEHLKIVWQLLAELAGVELLFHASVTGAAVADGVIRNIELTSCSRKLLANARVFIDATGEGDLAALAGAEFQQGDPEHGRTLHMTLTAILVDTGRPVTPYLPEGLAPIERPEDLPGLRANIRLGDGRVYLNMTKVMGLSPTDPFQLSLAERQARRQLARVVHFLQRTKYPTHTIGSSSASIGIREGRRIIGDYVLTEQDILAGECDFDDGVAVATSQIDFHSLAEPGDAARLEAVQPYAIPYRCLTVRGLRNLLTAGKCISGDQVAQSSYRMTPTCCAMGQAAGTAAAMAVTQGGNVRAIDVAELRRRLAAAGMELDPRKHESFAQRQARKPRAND